MKKKSFQITLITLCILVLLSFKTIQDDELKKSMERGKVIYTTHCQTCHMETGKGIEGVYPPLAKSDYLMADKQRAIRQVLEGAVGEMTVNGVKYYGFMTGFPLSDQEASDVINYIRNSWGNKAEFVSPDDVKKVR